MEEFKPIILVGGFIGIALISFFIYLTKRFEKKHPELFTDKASYELKKRYNNLTMKIFSGIFAYLFLFFGLLLFLGGCYSELIPVGIVGSVLIFFCLINLEK